MVSEGKIKELGTHDELIALNGLYADLVSTILPFTLLLLSLLLMPCISLYIPVLISSSFAMACHAMPCFVS